MCKCETTYLYKTTLAKARLNQRLGNPTSSIRSRSVHFSEVLARECTTAMSSPTTIRIDNNFSSSQPSITLKTTKLILCVHNIIITLICVYLWAAHYKLAAWINMENSSFVKILWWYHRLNNSRHNFFS